MVNITVSEGFKWVIDRLPNETYREMRDEIIDEIEQIAIRYGYTTDVKDSFKENVPVVVQRD